MAYGPIFATPSRCPRRYGSFGQWRKWARSLEEGEGAGHRRPNAKGVGAGAAGALGTNEGSLSCCCCPRWGRGHLERKMSGEWAGPVSFGDAELFLGWPRCSDEILGENEVKFEGRLGTFAITQTWWGEWERVLLSTWITSMAPCRRLERLLLIIAEFLFKTREAP